MHLYSLFCFRDRNCDRDWSSGAGSRGHCANCTGLGVVSFSWYLSAEEKYLFSITVVSEKFFFQTVFCLCTGESDNVEMLIALQTCLL